MTEPQAASPVSWTDAGSATVGFLTREYLSVYLYDWNEDGSPFAGSFVVRPDARLSDECRDVPRVGEEVIILGDGMGVVVRVTAVGAPQDNGHVVCETDYASRGRVRRVR